MKLVLFDCDGTIVDSADFIHRCMAVTFANAGLTEPVLEQTRGVIGLSLDKAIAVLADTLGIELGDEAELALPTLLGHLAPVDLVLIEGYKRDSHPKIEAHRYATGQPLIALEDPNVVAVASDVTPEGLSQPVLPLDDTSAIADFILRHVGLN